MKRILLGDFIMNIIEEIEKLKNSFIAFNGRDPNCVKLGKTEVKQLENWYNEISKPESNKKKVKIKDGAMIMGLCIIRTKHTKHLEIANEDISQYTVKTVILNPDWKAKVEVKDE